MNPAMVGVFSELAVMNEYTKRGYNVSKPVGTLRYDFVAEKDGRFVRIQVKTGTSFAKGKELNSFTDKPLTRQDIDVVVVFDPYTEMMYFIPVEHVEGQRNIRLRLAPFIYHTATKKALESWSYTKFIG